MEQLSFKFQNIKRYILILYIFFYYLILKIALHKDLFLANEYFFKYLFVYIRLSLVTENVSVSQQMFKTINIYITT